MKYKYQITLTTEFEIKQALLDKWQALNREPINLVEAFARDVLLARESNWTYEDLENAAALSVKENVVMWDEHNLIKNEEN